MSHSPFDGVLLDDPRPPISGAEAMLLHLRVARRLARRGAAPGLDAVRARAQACRELLAQGILPETLEALSAFGLDLGGPGAPHGLRSLKAHLEAYLQAVAEEGFLEPDEALWRAVDRHLEGGRGLWIERGPEDGPIRAGLRDLQGARLKALACVPGLSGAVFALAQNRGGRAGLFGSSQPLADWFLEGLERHGQAFPNELALEEPAGWGRAPWAPALEGLFEGPLDLGEGRALLRRGLSESPADLLRDGLEQICAWLDRGFDPAGITVVHPEPQAVAGVLAPLLAREGVGLHVRGGLAPLLESAAWNPLWLVLSGLQRLDPFTVAAGLRASRRGDLRAWAEVLGQADQDGQAPFLASFARLKGGRAQAAREAWEALLPLRDGMRSAREWAGALEALAVSFRLAPESDDFFAPMGLLKEAWRGERLGFRDMLDALRAFLEAARSTEVPRSPGGVRLVAPSTLLDDWDGCEAALVLDLSEGAWPASPEANPDLDWNRKAAINQALLRASEALPDAPFPPALQRFWLPRGETGDQVPRAFQREAYAFNKLLAMTGRELAALSPGRDAEGRTRAQGPFWSALEGAGAWSPEPGRAASRLRWDWDGHGRDPLLEERAGASLPRTARAALEARAPGADRVGDARNRWLKGAGGAYPTALEGLAACPFRSMAERILGLRAQDDAGRVRLAVGILCHHVLEAALADYVGRRDWNRAFLEDRGLGPDQGPGDLAPFLESLWRANREGWCAAFADLPEELAAQAALEAEALLPRLAAALLNDARGLEPLKEEAELLGLRGAGTWTRTLLGLEREIGPLAMPLGGRTLSVAGKLDRLELWEHPGGESFLRIVDYKTSKRASLKAYAEGDAPFGPRLQPTLYMLLAEQGLEREATSLLMPLREEDPKAFAAHLKTLAQVPGEDGWRGRLLGALEALDRRLEEGDFPPTPGDACRGCELGALCGRPADVETDEDEEGEA